MAGKSPAANVLDRRTPALPNDVGAVRCEVAGRAPPLAAIGVAARGRDPIAPTPATIGSGVVAVVAVCAASSTSTWALVGLRELGNDGHMDLVCVTVGCAAPAAVVGFWSEALRWRDVRVAPDGSGAVCRSPVGGAYLEFIRVPEGKKVKNRFTSGAPQGDLDRLDDEIARLVELGATVAWEEEVPTEVAAVYRNVVCETSKATSSASALATCRAHPPAEEVVRTRRSQGRPTADRRARRSTCRLDAPVAGPDRRGTGGDPVRLGPRRRRPA